MQMASLTGADFTFKLLPTISRNELRITAKWLHMLSLDEIAL